MYLSTKTDIYFIHKETNIRTLHQLDLRNMCLVYSTDLLNAVEWLQYNIAMRFAGPLFNARGVLVKMLFDIQENKPI